MLSNKLTKGIFAAVLMLALTNMTLATNKGDGETKKKSAGFKMSFTPSRVSVPFSMKKTLKYDNTRLTTFSKGEKFVLYSSVMTYRKGNIVYMIPVKQKLVLPSFLKLSPEKK